jgi:hypothetical protein
MPVDCGPETLREPVSAMTMLRIAAFVAWALMGAVLRGLEHVRRDFKSLDPPHPLSRREREVLRALELGYI